MLARAAIGRQFPALVIEDVAGEDVREKMLFEERVDDGREQLITAGQWDHFLTDQRRPDSGAVFIPV